MFFSKDILCLAIRFRSNNPWPLLASYIFRYLEVSKRCRINFQCKSCQFFNCRTVTELIMQVLYYSNSFLEPFCIPWSSDVLFQAVSFLDAECEATQSWKKCFLDVRSSIPMIGVLKLRHSWKPLILRNYNIFCSKLRILLTQKLQFFAWYS